MRPHPGAQRDDPHLQADEDSLSPRIGDREGMAVSLRWIMLHMIEETARHNGHVDVIRESIDGLVGE